MLRWYQAKLAQRPLVTQSITTAVLFAAGDTLAQQAVEKKGFANHDLARSGRMALYGGAIFGPAATRWYQFLQRKINLPNHNATIAARVLADQTVFSTTNLFCFLSSMAILEGSSPGEKLEKSYFAGLKANWLVWPAVQAINFSIVPLHHRVLVVNIVSLGWNCFLSYLNSGK
ncbi:Protein required for ethanol metabolism [Endocarpon pusillum]|uniref:Protein required for ethanol metabolism n=1 Tax=Endocarpon pusillum TaxID=364733 RepID=A0A8H7AV71_9EURO|nr:Protein required for ethanol metabolism [Endocarpon pusillum]